MLEADFFIDDYNDDHEAETLLNADVNMVKSVLNPELSITRDKWTVSVVKKQDGTQPPGVTSMHTFIVIQSHNILDRRDLWRSITNKKDATITSDTRYYHCAETLQVQFNLLIWGEAKTKYTVANLAHKTWSIDRNKAEELLNDIDQDIENPPKFDIAGNLSYFKKDEIPQRLSNSMTANMLSLPIYAGIIGSVASTLMGSSKPITQNISLFVKAVGACSVYAAGATIAGYIAPLSPPADGDQRPAHNCISWAHEKVNKLNIEEISKDLRPHYADSFACMPDSHYPIKKAKTGSSLKEFNKYLDVGVKASEFCQGPKEYLSDNVGCVEILKYTATKSNLTLTKNCMPVSLEPTDNEKATECLDRIHNDLREVNGFVRKVKKVLKEGDRYLDTAISVMDLSQGRFINSMTFMPALHPNDLFKYIVLAGTMGNQGISIYFNKTHEDLKKAENLVGIPNKILNNTKKFIPVLKYAATESNLALVKKCLPVCLEPEKVTKCLDRANDGLKEVNGPVKKVKKVLKESNRCLGAAISVIDLSQDLYKGRFTNSIAFIPAIFPNIDWFKYGMLAIVECSARTIGNQKISIYFNKTHEGLKKVKDLVEAPNKILNNTKKYLTIAIGVTECLSI